MKWVKWGKLLSHVWLLATPWAAAFQAPLFLGFSRHEYWSGLPLPSPHFHGNCYHFRKVKSYYFTYICTQCLNIPCSATVSFPNYIYHGSHVFFIFLVFVPCSLRFLITIYLFILNFHHVYYTNGFRWLTNWLIFIFLLRYNWHRILCLRYVAHWFDIFICYNMIYSIS